MKDTTKTKQTQKPLRFRYKKNKYCIEFEDNNYIFTTNENKRNQKYFNRIDHLLLHILSVLSKDTTAGSLYEFIEELKMAISAVRNISIHIYNNYTPCTELEKASTRWGKHVDEAMSQIVELPKPTKKKKA